MGKGGHKEMRKRKSNTIGHASASTVVDMISGSGEKNCQFKL